MVWTLLHSLAGDDDVQEIDALLKTGVDIEEKDLAGLTALHVASGEGSSNAVRVLCDNGANVNAAASYSHVSPLHRAVEEGHEECAGVLIELKADLEARTKEGFTPLHEAVRSGSMALVRLLLESQACVNSTCNTRSSPLHISILNEHHEISTFLVSQGADVYAPDDYGISACDQSGSEEQMRAIGIWKQNVILEELSEYILAVADKLGKESGIALKDPTSIIMNRKFRAYMSVKEFWTFLERRRRRNRLLGEVKRSDVENSSIRAKRFNHLYNASQFLESNIVEDEDAKNFITKTVQKAFPSEKDEEEEVDDEG